MKHCSECGAAVVLRVPPGDDRDRFVCSVCEHIHYTNPRVIVGCVAGHDDRVLLCRRAIEPRYGKWTLPAGFMENGETTEQGAVREMWEEAGARAQRPELYRLFDIPYINQVYVFFRCGIEDGLYAAGQESLEVRLFREQEIPWDEIAFHVVRYTLQEYFADRRNGAFPIRHSALETQRLPK